VISLDTNILVQAMVVDSPFHEPAFQLLSDLNASGEKIFLCWEVVHGFRRVSTNFQAVRQPLTADTADMFIDELVNHPHVTMLAPSVASWIVFKRYSFQMKLRGNLVTDAVIASQLEANGVKKLYSNDRDFRKFDYLKVIDPFAKKKRR
jgi:uncharacterized protein